VNEHAHVLKDSLSLIRQLESMSCSPQQTIILTSADVAVLYPSINIEDGMTFQHTSESAAQIYEAAQFALDNSYVGNTHYR
jgi:hypothetical protein